MHRSMLAAAAVLLLSGAAAFAEGFQRVDDRERFLSLVQNRDLTRLGVSLRVRNDGAITGRAFGRSVSGAWRWADGFFCRDLYFGSEDLGPNCQMVQVSGRTVRFISDRGQGIYADLRLD